MIASPCSVLFGLIHIFITVLFPLRQSPSRSPCRSPSIYRSSSSFSMSSPDLIGNLELEEKLKELEMMIKEQKSVIHQQKNVITDQKETIDHLEISANQKNRNDDNLEDID